MNIRMKVRWMLVLVVAVLSMVAGLPAHAGPGRVVEEDTNGDGKSDKWSYYDGEALVAVELDRDFDGRADRIEKYKNGRLDTEQFVKKDGECALIFKYLYKGGKLSYVVGQSPVEAGGQSRMVIKRYEDEKLVEENWDRNRDGSWDSVMRYRYGKWASVELDDDFDGRFEYRIKYLFDEAHNVVGQCQIWDKNADGKDDFWEWRKSKPRGKMSRYKQEADTNFDGAVDVRRYYEKDPRVCSRAELDTNHDGKLDTWHVYEGRWCKVTKDKDGDGKPEVWQWWDQSGIKGQAYDANNDGKLDRWDVMKTRELAARTLTDVDKDGLPDTVVTYSLDGKRDSSREITKGDKDEWKTIFSQ